ncbi:uncharacterized protein LOC110676460 [Aedes aegypti]|uniref:Uncharacterized protein n=1 Tax=Aedes aegypti TaxID=7159 RepID=A0A6I8U4W7_AEDAE|nr:uncharacterized protein LOC110676460 [Aedes aegypti]
MASNILDDLDIPRDLLEVFEQYDISVFELLTISVDELQQHLQPTSVSWCYDNLFSRIDSWRKRNKTQILNLLLNKKTLQEPSDKDPSHSSTVKSEHEETKSSNEVTLCQESQPEVLEEISAESIEGEQTLLSAEESQLSADLPEKVIEQSTSGQIPQPREERRSVSENRLKNSRQLWYRKTI